VSGLADPSRQLDAPLAVARTHVGHLHPGFELHHLGDVV